MPLRRLVMSDVPSVVTLYAKCMADDGYFRNAYRLRRATDRDALVDKLLAEHGPVLSRVVGHGASFGFQDGAVLAGFYVCFWYDAARRYDPELFLDVFAGPEGRIEPDDELHSRLLRLRGAVLYGLSVCVEPEFRRRGIATRLVRGAMSSLRPDFLATDVSCPESLPIYRRMLCSETPLCDGRTLCIVKA